MAGDNDEKRDYEGKLQAILRTCLLYNTSEALGNAVNYKLHGEGNKGFKGKPLPQLELIFEKLCAETSRNTDKEVDLDELLDNYKAVSEYWKSLRRTYSCNLHKPNEAKFQSNKNFLFALLDYTLDANEAKKKYIYLFRDENKYIKIANDFYNKSKGGVLFFEPLILLLMTGLLPKYDSIKQTKADNILDDYILLYDFLLEYSQKSVTIKNLRDLLAEELKLIRSATKGLRDKININANPSEEIEKIKFNRLHLILKTKQYFDLFKNCTNRQKLGKFIKTIDYSSTPDIEGIWTSIEGESTNFWKFEKVGSGYLLTNYNKKSDDYGKDLLEYSEFICGILENVFIISNLNGFAYIVKNNGNINERMAYFFVDFQSVNIGKGKKIIEKIFLYSANTNINWFSPRVFHRVQENDKNYNEYESWIDKLHLVNINPEENIFITEPTIGTPEFLYIPIDENNRIHMHASDIEFQSAYLKVPRKLNPVLQDVNFNSLFSLIVFDDKTAYVASLEHWLFWEITTLEQRKELGIELVDGVRDS